MKLHGAVEGLVQRFIDSDAVVDDFADGFVAVAVLSHACTSLSVYPIAARRLPFRFGGCRLGRSNVAAFGCCRRTPTVPQSANTARRNFAARLHSDAGWSLRE